MAITASDFTYRKATTNNYLAENGGRMSASVIPSSTKNNIFPDVTNAERISGLTRYRKIFCLIENSENLSLENAYAHLVKPPVGDDWMTLFEGTQTDTQSDISSPREYGVAPFSASASAGATRHGAQLCVPQVRR